MLTGSARKIPFPVYRRARDSNPSGVGPRKSTVEYPSVQLSSARRPAADPAADAPPPTPPPTPRRRPPWPRSPTLVAGLRAGLWLQVEASRRQNDPRKATCGC
jgi:hypothetical protein